MSERLIQIRLNGSQIETRICADDSLATVLRRLGFTGVKIGCEEGVCGSCTVLLDGKPVNACHLFAFQAAGRRVETIESIGTFEQPHPIQRALADEGAVQCGFCMPGLILSAKAMFDEDPHPDAIAMAERLDGHLCRCTGYEKIQSALLKLAAGKSANG